MNFQLMLLRLKDRAYRGNNLAQRWRAKRMQQMLKLVHPPAGARIIDLGGSEYVWNQIENKGYDITIVNLPGSGRPSDENKYRYIEADACDLHHIFPQYSFDLCFSNSVIEHVGDDNRQAMFAGEVRRLARAYWVQTPSDRFPIEVHTGIPFYWKLPKVAVAHLHRKWSHTLPGWCEMIQGTSVLRRQRMQDLFPDSHLYVERRLGFEKSYAAYVSWKK